MGSKEAPSPPSSGKHRRYSDEAASEQSKCRKHHHHRHHHRRHCRHESHGRDRDDGEKFKPIHDAAGGFGAVARVDDDEREEGEIVEDEDVEPGEIELDSDSNQAVCGAEHTGTIAQGSKEQLGDANSGGFHNPEPMVDDREVSGVKSVSGRRLKQSLSPQNSTGNDRMYRGTDGDDTSQARVESPVSGGSTRRKKYKVRHGDEDLDEKLQKLKFDRHSDSGDAGRESLNNNYNSKSPGSSRDKNKHDRRSPSYSRHHDEVLRRDRSRSRDYGRDKSCELEDGHGNHFRVKESMRNYSDSENSRVHDRLDTYMDRITESVGRNYREREKSSSYGRHNERDDRHGSRGRKTEKEGHYRSYRDTDYVEEGKRVRGVRERSSSHSRHDMQEKRHRSRDREHEQRSYATSLRGKERLRDSSKEKYKERESRRDVNGGRKRDRDESDRDILQVRGRERSRNQGTERGVKMDIDRVSSQERPARDNPRYDELEYKIERKKTKDLSKERRFTADSVKVDKEKPAREEDEEDYQEKVEQQLAKQDEEDIDKIKEESRKRRQTILEKHRQLQLQQHAASGSKDPEKGVEEKKLADNDKTPAANSNTSVRQVPSEGPDNRLDHSEVYVADPSFALDKTPIQNGEHSLEKTACTGGLGEGTPKSERSADMFCDDIFGESPAGVRRLIKSDCLRIETGGLHDNWDDAEGYYSYRFGEILDGRYEVIAAHGKGVFSTVVRAKDLKAGKGDPEEVAIKIIRSNETMYKAGLEELTILKRLAGTDPDDRRHCVRFISNFKYRNHLCLVFESLHMNLREVLKKFGRNIGLKLTAVRAYAKQLFIALKHLRNCGVLHCDIKPDNMLVNEAKNVLKLCDFGNAMFSGKNEITPYLVSRFYRAPEIILGLPYDHAMDIWSVGCCLYELYSGKVLFPGPSNNDMLRLQMELKGSFPKKMLRKGAFSDQHFDQDLNFHATEEDPVTKKNLKRLLLNIKPKDISVLISGSPGEDPKMLANFKDLLERIFVLDPEKRMTVSQALSHPFITGK